MGKINDGGPAFAHGDPINGGDSGMSLRDWFAGQALPTVMALIGIPDYPDTLWNESIAKHSYALADAMIAESAKETAAAERTVSDADQDKPSTPSPASHLSPDAYAENVRRQREIIRKIKGELLTC